MFDNKKYKLKTPRKTTRPKKPKKERSAPKMGGGKLFGGKLFQKESFGKASLGKPSFSEKKGKWPEWLKWWHILVASLLLVAIVTGIVLGIVLGGSNNPGGGGGGGSDMPEPEGTVTTVGSFTPNSAQEYILCEYTEYFSGETVLMLQKESDVRYDYKSYYVFVSENGNFHYQYSGEYTGEKAPEVIKAEILAEVQERYMYTDENIARCQVLFYDPIAFTRVSLSSATLAADGTVSITYSAGAVEGELVEHTLTGTYEKSGNDFTFTYENLPEDEHLLHVAEKLLAGAKYEYYAQYGSWVNKLTFADYPLYLITADPADGE